MLTRPGSHPGPAWMRNISESWTNPDRPRKFMIPFWAFFLLYMMGILVLVHFVTAVAFSGERGYESEMHIAGLPLVSYGPVAHGIIALGGRATGVVALGGIAVGFIAFGGLSIGVFGAGGLSIGLFSLAGLAIGWRAVGGLAIGQSALGSLAIGKYAYAGNGVAYGFAEACGRQREQLIR